MHSDKERSISVPHSRMSMITLTLQTMLAHSHCSLSMAFILAGLSLSLMLDCRNLWHISSSLAWQNLLVVHWVPTSKTVASSGKGTLETGDTDVVDNHLVRADKQLSRLSLWILICISVTVCQACQPLYTAIEFNNTGWISTSPSVL